MTIQLIQDLATVIRLMRLALENNDNQAYADLEPKYRQLVERQAELALVEVWA